MVVATGDGTMAAGRGRHDSRAVANRFVALAREHSEIITIMQLVKFVYLAHGWHLGFYGEPLICHEVQAWKFGPVIPEVYFAFRPQGIVVKHEAEQKPGVPYLAEFSSSSREEEIIADVFRAYSKLSGTALSALTHEPGTPWDKARGEGLHIPIPDSEIREYYKGQIDKARNAS